MTICAAAICKQGDESKVIAIADRMYTRGRDDSQTEYESLHSKVYCFRPNVIALTAGDGDSALDICRMTHEQIGATGASTVDAIANLYAANHATVRNRRIAGTLLAPLGLDLNSFVAGQHGLPDAVVSDTVEKMRATEMDLGTEALIFGVDPTGPHIYHVIEPGLPRYCEKLGFIAIGMGARLFETVFMSATYASTWPLSHALLLTYSAKRQAEMAPGVGKTTDIFIVGESDTRFANQREIQHIETRYALLNQRIANLRSAAVDGLAETLGWAS